MATATLQSVGDSAREFETKYGPMAAFDVTFTDGRKGQVVTKADTLERKQQQFRDLIGIETQFLIEDNGSWPDGNPKPLKVKLPAFGGGPGGGGGAARPPRDEAAIQERMDRRTALMQAVAEYPNQAIPVVLETADQMYAWLRQTVSSPAPAPTASAREAQQSGIKADPVAAAGDDVAPGGTTDGEAEPTGGHTQDCIHPETNRKVTASGKVRCGMCGAMVP